jgi:phage nucleotide-binding protein
MKEIIVAEIKIAGVDIQSSKAREQRISMLIWGGSGCGKTTLACTAPGKKLLINFDPDGDASIANRDDVDVVDLSSAKATVTEKFKSDNPLGLKAVIENYDTVIVDSMTNASQMALMHGVSLVKGATVERPSPGAYQVRNALSLQLIKNLLRLTNSMKKHIIFIAHEASPQMNSEGQVTAITIMLGGQLPEQASIDFSEVWVMTDTGKERRIAVRPARMRKPMKSRMFDTAHSPEFVWKFNADTLKGDGIAEWFNNWKEAGYKKQPLPK